MRSQATEQLPRNSAVIATLRWDRFVWQSGGSQIWPCLLTQLRVINESRFLKVVFFINQSKEHVFAYEDA